MTVLPQWVFQLRERIPALLKTCSAGRPGWYRLCASGDLLRPGLRAGLGSSCYAAKIMVQCGLWHQLPNDYRAAWVRYLQGFQLPPQPPGHGMFCDPWVESRGRWRYTYACLRGRRLRDLFRVNWQNRWAETRQAVSTLLAMGAQPLYPIFGFPTEPASIRRFLDHLNWQRPWGAGAQAGHLLFFLKHGQTTTGRRGDSLQAVLDYLAELESPETGGWYRGRVDNQQIVNGAMKIISGLQWWDQPIRYAEPLFETATSQTDPAHDCALMNRLFVLYHLSAQLGEVPQEGIRIAEASLSEIPQFFQSDGGLASNRNGSLRVYYYAPVSQGHPVGDLHGLTLFTMAITLSALLLGQEVSLRWSLVAP